MEINIKLRMIENTTREASTDSMKLGNHIQIMPLIHSRDSWAGFADERQETPAQKLKLERARVLAFATVFTGKQNFH